MVIDLPEVNEEAAQPAFSTSPAILAARGLLKDPIEPATSIWALVGTFGLLACCAMGLAVAVVMGPPQLGKLFG